MTRFLVTGAGGLLGAALVDRLSARPGFERTVVALGRAQLDVTDATAAHAALAYAAPDVVINAAGYTDVDGAESDPAAAAALNSSAPGVLADACGALGAVLVHVSTDYVFDGAAQRPYDVDDPVGPLGVYGRTKEAGERAVRAALPAHYIVRTSWLYGDTGRNFVQTMIALERRGGTLDVVDDQHGCPTLAADLATGLVELAESGAAYGTYHCTGEGSTTWFGVAQAVFEQLDADPARVRPCGTAEFPRPAPRPAYSVLSGASWRDAGLTPLRPWRDALPDALPTA